MIKADLYLGRDARSLSEISKKFGKKTKICYVDLKSTTVSYSRLECNFETI